MQENENYSLKKNNTVLDVYNILPSLAGDYYAYVVTKQDQSVEDMFDYSSFHLKFTVRFDYIDIFRRRLYVMLIE